MISPVEEAKVISPLEEAKVISPVNDGGIGVRREQPDDLPRVCRRGAAAGG